MHEMYDFLIEDFFTLVSSTSSSRSVGLNKKLFFYIPVEGEGSVQRKDKVGNLKRYKASEYCTVSEQHPSRKRHQFMNAHATVWIVSTTMKQLPRIKTG